MAKHVWKSKAHKNAETGKIDPNVKWMVCQNSDLEQSKYANWYLEDAPCKEWVLVDKNADAVLCWKCTMQLG